MIVSMKVFMINLGNTHRELHQAIHQCADVLKQNQIEVDILTLAEDDIQPCLHCGKCVKKMKCIFEDAVNEASFRMQNCDGVIIATPSYYDGIPMQSRAFLDRLFSSNPLAFANKAGGALIAARNGNAIIAYQKILIYFEIADMTIISSQYHGLVKIDDDNFVPCRLAKNMVQVLQGLNGRNMESPDRLMDFVR